MKDKLSENFMLEAEKYAQMRYRDSRQNGYNPYTFSGHLSGIHFEKVGVAGEMYMHAKTNGVFSFIISKGFKTVRDCGPFEVETVRHPDHHLLLRRADIDRGVPLNTPYVSVLIEHIGQDWFATMRGWYNIGDGLNHQESFLLQRDGQLALAGRRYVKCLPTPLLRPMTELEQLTRVKFVDVLLFR